MKSRSLANQGLRNRKGAIVILVAVALIAVFSCVAVTFDGGNLLERRRRAQVAADAAAMAAAENLFRNFPIHDGIDVDGSARQAALNIAALNGYDNTGADTAVTVRTSPDVYFSGANRGTEIPAGFVEVTVARTDSTFFGGFLGADDLPVNARAVAKGSWEPSKIGIHVLDLHESASLTATGESSMTVYGASIIVNSDAEDAATTTGGTIEASSINVTGGTSSSGNSGGFVGDVNLGTRPEPDPLRHLPEPDINGQDVRSNGPVHIANGTRTLRPGTYRGGISVSGRGNLVMEPGIYYMDGGGFSFAGQGNLLAEGVMIFNAPDLSSDRVSISGTGSVVMSPPTEGLYKGLTVFQERASSNTMSVSGGGYMDIRGTFYNPGGMLQVSGGGDSRVGSQYISRFLNVAGNGSMFIEYDKETAIPRRVLHLVE